MKTLVISLLVSSVLTFTACTNSEQKANRIEQESEKEIVKEEKSVALSLNNGKVWEANIETTEGIARMTERMDGFDQDSDQVAYESLSNELSKEFVLIFKKCTMTGPAHDQLHHYLLPMRKNFKLLSSENPEERKSGFNEQRERLNIYSVYFQ